MPRAKASRPPDPDRLVRRSAGDMHTEDGRFEVSSAGGAGRWYVTDTERHDQLGLALVIGPFGTLEEVRAAIAEQRSSPTGDDRPLPETAPSPRPRRQRRERRASSALAEPGSEPQPKAEPEPEPAPPPAPPVRITRARWRPRHDDRDAAVATIQRIDDARLSGDPDTTRDDLHASVVFVPAVGPRLEGQDAVIEGWRAQLAHDGITAWTEQDLSVDVVNGTAVVRYRYQLARQTDGQAHRDAGTQVWVLTRSDQEWRAVWGMMLAEPTGA